MAGESPAEVEMKVLVAISLCFLSTFSIRGLAKETCLAKAPEGFAWKSSNKGGDHYVNTRKTMALAVKCHDKSVKIAAIKKDLSAHLNFKKILGNIDYVDINRGGVLSRTYLVPKDGGVIQFSFVVDQTSMRTLNSSESTIKKWIETTR